MIERYSLSPMKELWTEEAKYQCWLQVELTVADVMAELGQIPKEVAQQIRKKVKLDIGRAKQIEEKIGHDFLAFVRAVEESVGSEGRFLHKGLTSYDVEDTALALAMRDGLDILMRDLKELLNVLKQRALEHKYTLMAGRTHGMHAEPITFGLKLLIWHEELSRSLKRLEDAKEMISYGKISGSVGTYANVDPEVERRVCARLGLKPAKISNQILQRDRHAQVLAAIALLGATLERLATEIRNLHRTEIAEVREGAPHGSSSMPHKQNPSTSETICGLARLLRAHLLVALENIAVWHEQDLSRSSTERIIIPDSFMVAHFMLRKMTQLIRDLIVDAERMKENLEKSYGVVFSQAVLLKLIEEGLARAQAHELIAQLARETQQKQQGFKELLLKSKEVRKYLSPEEIEALFDYRYHTKHVDTIFERFEQQA